MFQFPLPPPGAPTSFLVDHFVKVKSHALGSERQAVLEPTEGWKFGSSGEKSACRAHPVPQVPMLLQPAGSPPSFQPSRNQLLKNPTSVMQRRAHKESRPKHTVTMSCPCPSYRRVGRWRVEVESIAFRSRLTA